MANFFKEYKANHKSNIKLEPGEEFSINKNAGVDHSQIDFFDGVNLTKREVNINNRIMGIETDVSKEINN